MAGTERAYGTRSPMALVQDHGGRYSVELGIDLTRGDAEIFRWWLASILFGARISAKLAARAYRVFAERGLVTPRAITDCGWNGLVAALDAGGYARYDFKTATKLLDMCKALSECYQGRLTELQGKAASPDDLETRLRLLAKGIGAVTINIFLRELRGLWPKAQPALSAPALDAAAALGFISRDSSDSRAALATLQEVWKEAGGAPDRFPDFETALVKEGLTLRRAGKPGTR